jgi:tRNA1(Val) A37 N6-methylase TrmN6
MSISKEDKNNYGIVYTPNSLVDKILDLIPLEHYKNPALKWLDIGAGNGAFSLNLYNRLMNNLSSIIPNNNTRKAHILENMIYMCEIYIPHINKLETLFSHKTNIIKSDFLLLNNNNEQFNIIIGNPPYNINGALKTPTNNSFKKTEDGKQVYVEFVKKSLVLLKENGLLALIIPALWMKPDKAGLYNILVNNNFTINHLHCLSTNETQKEFLYQAQTPTCFFCGTSGKVPPNKTIPIYDKIQKSYINYVLLPNYPIPTQGINIINKLLYYVEQVGYLKVYKSNSPPKKSLFGKPFSNAIDTNAIDTNATKDEAFNILNIKTTNLSNKTPLLIKNYSNILQHYANIPKLILAHKMYGFPYLDSSGNYGISSRDNYILTINDYSLEELKQIQAFLSTKFALFIFSTTNYRMRYLEKYAFLFLPNITKIKNFPNLLNLNQVQRDKLIINFFNLSELEEITIANSLYNYNHFIDHIL